MSREESWAISKISSMRGLPFCVSSNPAPQPSGQAASGFNRVHKQGDGTLPAGTEERPARFCPDFAEGMLPWASSSRCPYFPRTASEDTRSYSLNLGDDGLREGGVSRRVRACQNLQEGDAMGPAAGV